MSLNWEKEKKKRYNRDYRALIGERFGKLTVESVEIPENKPHDQRFIVCHCRCDCGNKKTTSAFNLLVKDPHGVRSCGCSRVGGNRGHFKPLLVSEEELRCLYLEENLSIAQISNRLLLSEGVICRHLKRYGIEKDISLITESINRTKLENLAKNPKPPKIIPPDEWVVYKHTSPEGKSYIGQTKRIKHRWGKNGQGYQSSDKFEEAIKKFGWENFTHEILEKGIPSQEKALEREKFWIAQLDTFHNGYNGNEGGFLGPLDKKSILQIEPDTLKIVNRFESLMAAVKKTGISAPCISQCCKRIIQTAGKYCWCYEEDYSENWEMPQSSVRRGRRIYCIETGEVFHSPQEVERKTGISSARVTRACGGGEKYKWRPIGGLHYCYLGEQDKFIPTPNKSFCKVRCLETGEEFETMLQAAKVKNLVYDTLKNCVKNNRATPDGLHWEKVE